MLTARPEAVPGRGRDGDRLLDRRHPRAQHDQPLVARRGAELPHRQPEARLLPHVRFPEQHGLRRRRCRSTRRSARSRSTSRRRSTSSRTALAQRWIDRYDLREQDDPGDRLRQGRVPHADVRAGQQPRHRHRPQLPALAHGTPPAGRGCVHPRPVQREIRPPRGRLHPVPAHAGAHRADARVHPHDPPRDRRSQATCSCCSSCPT